MWVGSLVFLEENQLRPKYAQKKFEICLTDFEFFLCIFWSQLVFLQKDQRAYPHGGEEKGSERTIM